VFNTLKPNCVFERTLRILFLDY